MSRSQRVFGLSGRPHVYLLALSVLPSCGRICDDGPDSYVLVPGSYGVIQPTNDPRMNQGASVIVTDDTLRIEYIGDDGQPHFALYSYSPADTGTP